MTTTNKPSPGEIQAALARFTGTETWHRHWLRRFTYTDGVKYLAEAAEAFWLIDAIASWQLYPDVAAEPFQAWTLKRDDQGGAVLTATDGGKEGRRPKTIAKQEIPFTDFPLREVELWLENGVLMLPSER